MVGLLTLAFTRLHNHVEKANITVLPEICNPPLRPVNTCLSDDIRGPVWKS